MSSIVGFDPGETIGVSVFDLEGKPLLLESFRGGFSEVVEKVAPFAPLVIATDVAPAPASVRKLAAAFNAVVYQPEVSESVSEKTELSRPFYPRDAHQRDACAAALVALNEYQPLIERAKRNKGSEFEKAVTEVLRREAPNIAASLQPKEKIVSEPKYKLPVKYRIKWLSEEVNKLKEKASQQYRIIESLKNERERLLTMLKNYSGQRKPEAQKALEGKIRVHLMKEEKIASAFRKFEGKEVVVVPNRMKGDVVFVPVYNELSASKVDAKIVITERVEAKPRGHKVVTLGEVGGRKIDGWVLVPKENFPKLDRNWLVNFVEAYKRKEL